MQYIKFTYVDAVTGISIASEPAANGPVFPPVDGLEFVWARESAYPTDVPGVFGTCPDDANTQIDGVLGVYLQADWETMCEDEMRARNPVPQQVTMRQARRAAERRAAGRCGGSDFRCRSCSAARMGVRSRGGSRQPRRSRCAAAAGHDRRAD